MGYINKDELLAAIGEENGELWTVKGIKAVIDGLSSAEPEIIRCKDCTRFEKRGCNLVDGLNIAKADSFCSYAERKGEQNG